MAEFTFDYDELSKLVSDACRQAFSDMQAEHSDERFYNFALYASAEHHNLTISASTEEGLEQVANKYYAGYLLDELGEVISLEKVKTELRYFPVTHPTSRLINTTYCLLNSIKYWSKDLNICGKFI